MVVLCPKDDRHNELVRVLKCPGEMCRQFGVREILDPRGGIHNIAAAHKRSPSRSIAVSIPLRNPRIFRIDRTGSQFDTAVISHHTNLLAGAEPQRVTNRQRDDHLRFRRNGNGVHIEFCTVIRMPDRCNGAFSLRWPGQRGSWKKLQGAYAPTCGVCPSRTLRNGFLLRLSDRARIVRNLCLRIFSFTEWKSERSVFLTFIL